MPGTTPTKKPGDESSALWRISGLGIELAGAIIGMLLLGWALDSWLGTQPRWMMIGAAVGILGGGYNFIRAAMKLNRESVRRYQESHRRALQSPAAEPPSEGEDPSAESIRRRLAEFEHGLKQQLDEARLKKVLPDDE